MRSQRECARAAGAVALAGTRVRAVPPVHCRVVVALLCAAAFGLPVGAAGAQTSTIPEEGAGVSTTPPVELPGDESEPAPESELPNTGADPRVMFLAGLSLLLIGFGLRLRTADADEY